MAVSHVPSRASDYETQETGLPRAAGLKMGGGSPSGLSACGVLVRRHDRDRYLTALFAPAALREDLFALYAFNLEVAKTAEVVSEPLLGQIRLQWWQESLEGIYGGNPRAHEVVTPLHAAVQRHGLTREHFDRLLTARALDLDELPPANLAALEDYAEATSSSLVLLTLDILGVNGEAAARTGQALGLAWALTGLLRAIPFQARRRRTLLPTSLIDKHGVELGELYELRSAAALRRAVAELAARAEEHLATARREAGGLPRTARPALLLGTLAERHLKTLRAVGHDPFDQRVQAQRPGDVWRLAWAAFRW